MFRRPRNLVIRPAGTRVHTHRHSCAHSLAHAHPHNPAHTHSARGPSRPSRHMVLLGCGASSLAQVLFPVQESDRCDPRQDTAYQSCPAVGPGRLGRLAGPELSGRQPRPHTLEAAVQPGVCREGASLHLGLLAPTPGCHVAAAGRAVLAHTPEALPAYGCHPPTAGGPLGKPQGARRTRDLGVAWRMG